MKRVVTVRVTDWRREQYFAIDSFPTQADVHHKTKERFMNIADGYMNDAENMTPKSVAGQHNSTMLLTSVKVDEERYAQFKNVVDVMAFGELFTMAVLNLHFNSGNDKIKYIAERLGLKNSEHETFRKFLRGEEYV